DCGAACAHCWVRTRSARSCLPCSRCRSCNHWPSDQGCLAAEVWSHRPTQPPDATGEHAARRLGAGSSWGEARQRRACCSVGRGGRDRASNGHPEEGLLVDHPLTRGCTRRARGHRTRDLELGNEQVAWVITFISFCVESSTRARDIHLRRARQLLAKP